MSKPSGQRTHKAEIEARRARGGYEPKPRPTHPQRDARRQAAAYRADHPRKTVASERAAGNLLEDPGPEWDHVSLGLRDPLRYAESYRTW